MKVTFLSLSTRSKVGGIQKFNSRVEKSLSNILNKGSIKTIENISLSDNKYHDVRSKNISIKGAGGKKLLFLYYSVKSAMGCDVVLLGHINLVQVALLLRILGFNRKIILFGHGVELWGDPEYRKPKLIEKYLLDRLVDRYAIVSQYTANKMIENFNCSKSKVSIFPNAVDVFCKNHSEVQKKINSVICVCRLDSSEKNKNVDVLVHAISLLISEGEAVELTVVGGGDLVESLVSLAKNLNISNKVNFKGKISDDELNAEYNKASIFVLPSTKEGFGIVYLEAWMHGLPVVAVRSTAIPEIIENEYDGLIVDELSPTGLAMAIKYLIDHPDKAEQMAKNGVKKILNKYSNDAFQNRLEKLLLNSHN